MSEQGEANGPPPGGAQNGPIAVDPTVDELRLRRHDILSTALPFPKLDWTTQGNDKNLELVRDYAEGLANSTLDWYLHHQKWKKRLAQSLHFIIFLFVALATIPPLLKLGIPNRLQSECTYCDWVNSHAGEVALVLLGIAGVAKLWDSNAGYTVDWMRFFTTAAAINRELTKFEFDWDKIDLERRAAPPITDVSGNKVDSSDTETLDLYPDPASTRTRQAILRTDTRDGRRRSRDLVR
ncbi:SLATT domain-containing protein [Bradyrhizobium sp. DASA03120]|uniref:SLATT domain-containing protein n=1 Tax=Bradyrhizobium sp. SMVTL-02 TaxID=3395917 RepID=UPI003F70D9FA